MNSASVQGLLRCVVKEASDVPSKDLKGLGKATQNTLCKKYTIHAPRERYKTRKNRRVGCRTFSDQFFNFQHTFFLSKKFKSLSIYFLRGYKYFYFIFIYKYV
jgi:hypothetical protein